MTVNVIATTMKTQSFMMDCIQPWNQ